MKKHLLFLTYLIFLNILTCFSQEIFKGKTVTLEKDKEAYLNKIFKTYDVFSIDISSLNSKLSSIETQSTLVLRLDNKEIKLTISPNEIRAKNYLSSYDGIVTSENITPPITYIGHANDNVKDDIRLMVTDTKIKGYIIQNGEPLYISQLRYFGFQDYSKNVIIAYRHQDIIDTEGYCGVSDLQEQQFLLEEIRNKGIANTKSNGCEKVVELATDADYEFYQRYGSGTNDEILAIINMIEGLYLSTFDLSISITHQNVWTTSSDPYTGNPSTSPGSELLVNELRTYWESNMQNVQRDLVHLFSGRDYNQSGVLGRVYEIGTVCKSPDKSYGFTKDRINQFLTTAHEIGHNFGGIHSDGQNCGTSNASLMCQGDKSIPMYFSTASITRMSNFMNSHDDCISYKITGPTSFCTSATYNIPNLPTGATVTWSATGSISISGSITANPVSVSKSIDGIGTLTATVSTACGSFNLSKMINIGTPALGMPSFTNLDNQNPNWCSNNSGNSFTVETNDLSATYEARLLAYPSLNVYAINSNAYPGFDVFGYVPPGYYVFQLRATNACGTSAWVETEVESVYCTSDWESNNLNVYPNPAKETLTITYENTEGMQAFELSKTASEEKHLLLFDDKGKEVKKDMMKAGDTKLEWDIKNLPSGRYFLHIKEDKEVVKKQIIIKH